MSFVCSFYEWAYDRKHITGVRLSYESFVRKFVRVGGGLLGHVRSPSMSGRPILVPRAQKHRDLPHYFNLEEQERFFELLNERDSLIAAWALHTGARQHEVCKLRLSDIPPQSAYRSRRTFPIRIIGKGSKPGDLHAPTWLLDKTYRYIKFFGRKRTVHNASGRGAAVSDRIFLSRWGNDLKPDSVYRAFKKTLKQAGLRGKFHDLRHTYAIWTLDALMKTPRHSGTNGHNALLELKERMRHGSLETTEIYLKARDFYLDDIESELWVLR